jgi:hypothetical protein
LGKLFRQGKCRETCKDELNFFLFFSQASNVVHLLDFDWPSQFINQISTNHVKANQQNGGSGGVLLYSPYS